MIGINILKISFWKSNNNEKIIFKKVTKNSHLFIWKRLCSGVNEFCKNYFNRRRNILIFYVICTIHFMLFNINNLPVVVAVAVVVFVLAVVRKEMMDIKGSDHNWPTHNITISDFCYIIIRNHNHGMDIMIYRNNQWR